MQKQLFFVVSLFFIGLGYGQESIEKKIPLTTIKQTLQKSSFENVLNTVLESDAQTEFRAFKSSKDKLNQTHTTYRQFYKGIEVEMSSIRLHNKNGVNISYNGAYFEIPKINTTPSILEQNVVTKATAYFDHKDIFWLTDKGIETTPHVELVILPNRRMNTVNLAYSIGVGTSSPELKMGILYIDAHTGEMLKFKNQLFSCFHNDHNKTSDIHNHTNTIATAFATGTGATVYSGSQSLETDLDNGDYILYDVTRANTGSGHLAGDTAKFGIATVNMNHSSNLNDYNNGSVVTEFEDTNNTWTAAEMSSDEDQYALDAHWGAQLVYDYFKNEHGRDSYDGNNSSIVSYVHFGTNYTNAAWASFTNGRGFMIYGDGGGSFTPLTNLDVVAHEIGHGVQNNTSDLDYELESGAINEGLSDIWSMIIDNYANTSNGLSKNINLINDENGGGTFRSMSNPNAYGQPDTYGGVFWYDVEGCTPNGTSNDYCGVHTNSGVLNYMFYLLVNGGSGTNDINNSFDVTGIGMEDAADIIYLMQSAYLTSTSDYSDARDGAIQAAVDLFGICSQQEQSVTNAFHAVGVGDTFQAKVPSITSQPSSSITVAENGAVNLSITATDYSTIQWIVSQDGGNSWNTRFDNLTHSGDEMVTLSLSNIPLIADGYKFRAFVENDCGESVLSQIITLSVVEYTTIPDSNFEAVLEDLGYDDISNDGQVPTDNINSITSLNVGDSNISDLTGIEDFIALESLAVNNNSVKSIDVSSNVALKIINARENGLESIDVSGCLLLDLLLIEDNNLTSLDISNNTNLTRIWAQNNDIESLDTSNNLLLRALGISNSNLTSLDLSTNTALQQLYAGGNGITEMDVSQNVVLRIIGLNNNELQNLNVRNGNNTNVTNFSLTNNPNLTCILVDDANYSDSTWTNIDVQTNFTDTDYCRYTSIPDSNFESELEALGYDDISGDGQVPTALIETVTSLEIGSKSIADLTGIEDFAALITLICEVNQLTALDLSANTQLETLDCDSNDLTSLALPTNGSLKTLYCSGNSELTTLDLSSNTDLELASLPNNNLSSINLSNLSAMKQLYLNNNNLTAVDLSDMTALEDFSGASNQLTTIDVSANNKLISLSVDSNSITSLDIQNNTSLQYFTLSDNQIGTIDVTKNTNLLWLYAQNCGLSSIDISQNVLLQKLWVNSNDLTNIDISNHTAIIEFGFSDNSVTTLDVSNNTALQWLIGNNNQLTSLDLNANSALNNLNLDNNNLSHLNLKNGNNTNLLSVLITNNENLTCVQVDDLDYSTNNWTIIDDQTSFSEIECISKVLLMAKVFLQGAAINPIVGEENLMRDDLRKNSLINSDSPYGDGAEITEVVGLDDNGSNSIVDWIWIELLDANDPSVVVSGKSTILQRDGDIVDVDDNLITPVTFEADAGDYYIAIKHRNHLSIRSANTISLSATVTNIDFATNTSDVEGEQNALTDLGNGVYAMIAGDYDKNGQIQNTDINTVITLLGSAAYNSADMDMNGQIQNTDINNIMNPNTGKGEQF